MPKLYQNRTGGYYTKTRNRSGQVITLQISAEGQDWLNAIGINPDDNLGVHYSELYDNDWLYTKGEIAGGGNLVDDIPTPSVLNNALRISPPSAVAIEEPITIPCDNEFSCVPRFLFAPHRSIYYTIMYIENSSDRWLEVPLLIKNRGALALLAMGAILGDEFTETGLSLLFERRWAYLDDDRLP